MRHLVTLYTGEKAASALPAPKKPTTQAGTYKLETVRHQHGSALILFYTKLLVTCRHYRRL